MKRSLYLLILPILALVVSCVHQFPDEATPAQLEVALEFDSEIAYFRAIKFPEETAPKLDFEEAPETKPVYFEYIQPDWKTEAHLHKVRYVVQAHRVLSEDRIATNYAVREVFYDDDPTSWDRFEFDLMLQEGVYEVRVWADYIGRDSNDNLYYDPTDFSGITLNLADGHHGNTDFRDAYSGKARVKVVRYGAIDEPTHIVVPMSHPMGKYVFVTDDLEEFAEKVVRNKGGRPELFAGSPTKSPDFNIEDYELTIRCSQYMPTSYSMVTDRANDSKVNVQFKSSLKAIDDNYAIMGFDYVLANPLYATNPVTKIVLDIILKDKDGNVLATHERLYVPVKRGKMTLVEGSFLMQESDGGVSIDPGFDGPDIIVPVN